MSNVANITTISHTHRWQAWSAQGKGNVWFVHSWLESKKGYIKCYYFMTSSTIVSILYQSAVNEQPPVSSLLFPFQYLVYSFCHFLLFLNIQLNHLFWIIPEFCFL
jgi:hypothetical protein